MHNTDNKHECCPVFDPEPWESKTHTWENKLFIMETIPQLFHIPIPSNYGRAVTRMWESAEVEGAAPDLKNFLLLAYDPSPWKSELYMAVNKDVPGAKNVKLSGIYISKVFDGPYSHVPKYIKELDKYLECEGKKAVKYYFYFTTCPKCEKKYGHNYIVALAEVNLTMVLEMEEINRVIDIETAIRNGNNKFLKSLPGFLVRFIKRIIHEDEMNATIHRSRHLTGGPFINDILNGFNVKINIKGGENIPSTGRYIFVANHPVGGMDALSFFSVVYRYFKDVISPSNELLNIVRNLQPLILGLNVFGKTTKEIAVKLHDLFESDSQVLLFPSGEVSRRKKGIISDPVWQKSFITKAVQHKRDIIPVHISGRNSNLFYRVANFRTFLGIKMYVETMLLPREMMKQRNSTVTVTIGKVIHYKTFTTEFSHYEWAQKVKSVVYSLPENQKVK